MFGDWLYQLTPRDQQSQGIELAFRSAETLAAALLNITQNLLLVPQDRCFVIISLSLTAVPNAAAQLDSTRFFIQGPAYSQAVEIDPRFYQPLAAGAFRQHGYQPDQVLVPPGWTITAQANFTAALAHPSVRSNVYGYFIPRGSLSLP